jgi:putative lipoprotein
MTVGSAFVISDDLTDKEINMSNESVKTIGGSVRYLQKIALPPNSTLYVSLRDVSLADAPAKELASQVTPHAETAGLSFNLTYSLADVLPGHTYAIWANIRTDDELIFTTTRHHSVELGVDYVQGQEVLVSPLSN